MLGYTAACTGVNDNEQTLMFCIISSFANFKKFSGPVFFNKICCNSLSASNTVKVAGCAGNIFAVT